MKITPDNLLQHELIGLRTEVEDSSNRNMRGLCGTIVDETRNMIIIEEEHRKEKKIPKAGNVFVFELPEEEDANGRMRIRMRVRGDMLVSRPEDRIKKRK